MYLFCVSKSFSITGNFTCQSRCNVTIKDVAWINNKLVGVNITVGHKIYEYLPCQPPLDWEFWENELHMNVICESWTEGKYMKHTDLK